MINKVTDFERYMKLVMDLCPWPYHCVNFKHIWWKHKLSVEYKKVVSAFSSACRKNRFCAQNPFVFYCLLAAYFVHENVNTLNWDPHYISKYVTFPVLSIFVIKHRECHLQPLCIHTTKYNSQHLTRLSLVWKKFDISPQWGYFPLKI